MQSISLIKRGILISLALLSPEILAAENLNFNYTRSDALSLDPRLALQAKACHSLGDPMEIRVRFKNVMMTSGRGQGLMAKIEIIGFPYPKGSTPFVSDKLQYIPAVGGIPGTDPDLRDEWGVNVQGSAKGLIGDYATVNPAATETVFTNPFCFSLAVADIGGSQGFKVSRDLIPIYKYLNDANGNPNPYYRNGYWDTYCAKRPDNADLNWYWPDYYNPPMKNYGNSSIKENISRVEREGGGTKFLTGHMFFGSKYVSNPAFDKPVFVAQGGEDNKVEPVNDDSAIFSYTFLPDIHNLFFVTNGEYILRTSTREITSIKLTLYDGKDADNTSVFEWLRNVVGGYATDNNLYYNTRTPRVLPVSPKKQAEKDDPYAKFYTNPDYFRGTLVGRGSLNQNYKTYVDTKTPLSLPPDYEGTINLVNTDSLTFTIDQTENTGLADKYFVTLSGQPMKFGPLYTNYNKEAFSAMQVRNACY